MLLAKSMSILRADYKLWHRSFEVQEHGLSFVFGRDRKRGRMSKLHGFRRGEETIHITHLPDYKKPVLLIGNGYCSQKIASFDSEEMAEGFCKMLSKWLMVESEGKE